MKMQRAVVLAVAALGVAGWNMSASADAAAGKAKFAAVCGECHEASDFEGEDAKALADSIGKMAAGQMKHKSAIKLSPQEITDVAAYMAGDGK